MWLFHICLDRTRRRASMTLATTTSVAVGSSWPRSKRWWSFLSDTPASSRLSESRCTNMWLAFHHMWIRLSTCGHKTWHMKSHEITWYVLHSPVRSKFSTFSPAIGYFLHVKYILTCENRVAYCELNISQVFAFLRKWTIPHKKMYILIRYLQVYNFQIVIVD